MTNRTTELVTRIRDETTKPEVRLHAQKYLDQIGEGSFSAHAGFSDRVIMEVHKRPEVHNGSDR